jgi:hypothetical protein
MPDDKSRIQQEILSRYHRREQAEPLEIPEPEEKPMSKRDPVKNVMLRLTSEEYERLNGARRRNNLDSLSDNQIVRKLLFDQLDQEEVRHETRQRHASAMGIA